MHDNASHRMFVVLCCVVCMTYIPKRPHDMSQSINTQVGRCIHRTATHPQAIDTHSLTKSFSFSFKSHKNGAGQGGPYLQARHMRARVRVLLPFCQPLSASVSLIDLWI